MAYKKIELFGHIVYSPDLSYHDLLEREESVKNMVQEVLESSGGSYIHFEALGDTLRFQCALAEERDEIFHNICDDFAPHVKDGLDARLLIVDKDLDTLYSYSIVNGKWQEAVIGLPAAGRLDDAPPVKVANISTDHPVPGKIALKLDTDKTASAKKKKK